MNSLLEDRVSNKWYCSMGSACTHIYICLWTAEAAFTCTHAMAAALRTCGLTEVRWVALLPSSHLPSSDSTLAVPFMDRFTESVWAPLSTLFFLPWIWYESLVNGVGSKEDLLGCIQRFMCPKGYMSAQEKFDFSFVHHMWLFFNSSRDLFSFGTPTISP